MEQVMELLDLIKGLELRGELVAASFIVRRIQPCKERAHPGFYFRGDNYGTRECTERLMKKEVTDRARELFTSNVSFSWPKDTKAFNCTNPPPQVIISISSAQLSIVEQGTDLLMQRSIRKTGQCTFRVCQELIGRQRWTPDHHLHLKIVLSVFLQSPEVPTLIGWRVLPQHRRKSRGRGQR